MQVSDILARATACASNEEAHNLALILGGLVSNFTEMEPCAGPLNASASFDRQSGAALRFDHVRKLSAEYCTEIRSEVREGHFTIAVTTMRLPRQIGLEGKRTSQDGLVDRIDGHPNQDLRELICIAKDKAILHHAQLIERVGVPAALACHTAESTWTI